MGDFMAGGKLCPQSEAAPRSVLVVEDEVLERLAIADQLRQAGYEVIEAANAHEALQVLQHSNDVKLIISDVRMPGSIDGVALARLVRAEHPDIKIVLASGHLASLDWVEHDGYFRKPYDIRHVVEHIKTLIG